MEPVKYYQIQAVDPKTGILRPLEVHKFGEPDSFFETEEQAEKFIKEMFFNSQMDINKEVVDLVLVILPVFQVRFKRN